MAQEATSSEPQIKEQKPQSEKERDAEYLDMLERALKRAKFSATEALILERDTGIDVQKIEWDFNPTAKKFDLKVKSAFLKEALDKLKTRLENNLVNPDYRWTGLQENLFIFDRYRIGNPTETIDAMLKEYLHEQESLRKTYGWPNELLIELRKYNYFPTEEHKHELREVGRDYVESFLVEAERGPHGQGSINYEWINREKEYKKMQKRKALLAFEFLVEKGVLNEEEDEDLFEKVTAD